jgi:APA family basic amino acid/polyamine antiporter
VGVFRLRRKWPDLERPYKVAGYPVVPAAYSIPASVVLFMLCAYRGPTTWPGLVIMLLGLPVYAVLKGRLP